MQSCFPYEEPFWLQSYHNNLKRLIFFRFIFVFLTTFHNFAGIKGKNDEKGTVFRDLHCVVRGCDGSGFDADDDCLSVEGCAARWTHGAGAG